MPRGQTKALAVEDIEAEVRKMDPKIANHELRAATILLSALQVGTSVRALTAYTAYTKRQVQTVVDAALKNGIFTADGKIAGAEWFKKDGAMALWCDVACCLGLLQKVRA